MVCPYCKSEHVHTGNRGWNLTSGFIGSGKVVVTCLDCGKKSKPGQKPSAEVSVGTALAVLVVIAVALIYISRL
jgi:hypothetical protein